MLYCLFASYFYRTTLNAGRSSREKGVCPSVYLAVCQTREFGQNGRKICPDFYTVQKIILA